MSQERNVKASILNYVENFIDKRDQELRGTSSDEDEYQRKRKVDRDAIVIKSGDEDYPLERLVNIFTKFSFLLNFLLDFSRIIVHQHQRISMLMNSISMVILLLKRKKVVNKSIDNKFIYVNINHQHLNLWIFKYKKL